MYLGFVKLFCRFAAGVIDQGYRGNVGVILFNFSNETFRGIEKRL